MNGNPDVIVADALMAAERMDIATVADMRECLVVLSTSREDFATWDAKMPHVDGTLSTDEYYTATRERLDVMLAPNPNAVRHTDAEIDTLIVGLFHEGNLS